MHARLLCLLALSACAPNVEVTSATISDSHSGSAEGGDCDDVPASFLAMGDAIDRLDVSTDDLAARATSIRGALAEAVGLPQDADAATIAAAITAFEQYAFDGAATLVAGDVRCGGSLPAARDNLTLCETTLIMPVRFECAGNCLVEAAQDCPGNAWCRGNAESCEGRCTGICETVGAACDGTCVGECAGTCGCTDGPGTCNGVCEGTCTGDCEVIAAACEGTCIGECEAVAQTCTSSLVCTDSGPYCTFDCERWAAPVDGSGFCGKSASLAGAAELRCEIPRARLVHSRSASVTCGDIEATVAVLEERGAALETMRVRLDAIQSTIGAFGAAATGLYEGPDVPACAIPIFQDAAERLDEDTSLLTSIGMDVEVLRNAIAQ
jgi:hypothetical protein